MIDWKDVKKELALVIHKNHNRLCFIKVSYKDKVFIQKALTCNRWDKNIFGFKNINSGKIYLSFKRFKRGNLKITHWAYINEPKEQNNE